MEKAKELTRSSLVIFICLFSFLRMESEAGDKGVQSGERYDRLVIRNVIVLDGKATPPRGPMDIILKGNQIESEIGAKSAEAYREEEHVLDGTGMYLLPGLINAHGSVREGVGGMPLPFEYSFKLWMACGITSVRSVSGNTEETFEMRRKSQEGLIAAPRIFIYKVASRGPKNPEEMRQKIRQIKEMGADGVKLYNVERDVMKAALEEAHNLGLRVAHDAKIDETNAWDDIAFGTTTIEHWYGIPDAALKGVQNLPHWYNYTNENERFRYAGRLWREADPEKLKEVLQAMVDKGVAWDTTFAIYEANRDLVRAQNQPWFKDYLHPSLETYFEPNPANHGSYFWNWTTTDEVFWKENYRLWMKAARDFANMGGIIGVGEDAPHLYMIQGFTLIREMELQHEAGFHPIDVIKHATGNNAKILGMEGKLGRVRSGYLADLILVDGNPLENLKYLYPTGVVDLEEGRMVRRGGVKWTIKDGFIYDAPELLEEVKTAVERAKKGAATN